MAGKKSIRYSETYDRKRIIHGAKLVIPHVNGNMRVDYITTDLQITDELDVG